MSRQPRSSRDKQTSMVLLMGNTGAGKSFFANKLKEGATLEGSGLHSCTQECQLVQTRIGATNVSVVDTPGFNDTRKSDTQTLTIIAQLLSSQYIIRKNVKLRGIIYFFDITKARMEGSDVKALEIFSKLVGEKAFPHVVFVTTKWGKLLPSEMDLAYKHEKELRDKFWGDMLDRGSHATRFDGNKASAEGILTQLIGKKDVSLRIQHELMEQDMTLELTAAGAAILPVVTERLSRFKSMIKSLQERLERESNSTKKADILHKMTNAKIQKAKAQKDADELKNKVGLEMKTKISLERNWQDNLRTVCSVLQIGFIVVMQVAIPVATGAAACNVM